MFLFNKITKLFFSDLCAFVLLSTAGYLAVKNLEIIRYFSESISYEYLINFFLSIGLYTSVSSINLDSLKENKSLILKAVTIGVILKIVIIAFSIHLFSLPLQESLFLAIIVAQIDPLSVAALIEKGEHRLSERANTIIRAWSSFDDPITALFAAIIVIYISISGNSELRFLTDITITFISFMFLLLATYLYRKRKLSNKILQTSFFIIFLLLGTFHQEFLLTAATGILIRPKIILSIVNKIIKYIYYLSIILMGMKLIYGLNLYYALLLALSAVIAQVAVGYIMTSKLPVSDRWFICFSQQNGLTAIILALLLLKFDQNLIMIVAPAIFIINLLHMSSNAIIMELTP